MLEKMDIVMTVLGSVMGRVSVLENNLSQVVQFQIQVNFPPPQQPPTVVIEPIDIDIEDVVVKEKVVGKGNSPGIENEISDAMIDVVVNSDSYNQVD